jgi:hypothetical protein
MVAHRTLGDELQYVHLMTSTESNLHSIQRGVTPFGVYCCTSILAMVSTRNGAGPNGSGRECLLRRAKSGGLSTGYQPAAPRRLACI